MAKKDHKHHKDPVRYKVITQYEGEFKNNFIQLNKLMTADLKKTLIKMVTNK